MTSEAYRGVLRTFVDDSREVVVDGPDVGGLLRLPEDEQVAAERELLGRLSEHDSRPAVGLGALRSWRAAPRIRELLRASAGDVTGIRGRYVVNTAVALWRIERSPEALEKMRLVLASSSFSTSRVDAARLLAEFHHPSAAAALDRAMESDADPVVRSTAGRSLLHLHGIEATQGPPRDATVALARARDDEARRGAARRVRELIDGVPLVPDDRPQPEA